MTTITPPAEGGRGGERMEGTAANEHPARAQSLKPLTTQEQPTDLTPLSIIRTETVFSKLPIHNLSKKGRVDILITRKNEHGEIDLHWEVSYSDRYGQARQLAYRLDTIIINRRIDEAGRPLQKILCLGSLNEVCRGLGIDTGGKTMSQVKKAFLQDASAFIKAKLTYRRKDGAEKYIEFADTRYGIVFTGERLPGGRKADAVYLILHDPYREILNNAPIRPLNYDYLKSLSPAPQRFYEIVSYRIFAAIKYKLAQAKILYSEYCTFSAQQRYYDYDHFKKQMYKVHRPHFQSGYIEKVAYEKTTDTEGKPDWLMLYTPGPQARAEYQTFNRKHWLEDELTAESRGEGTARLPTKEKEQLTLQAEELVAHFYSLFPHNGENVSPTPREINQAQGLITTHSLEKARFILDYAKHVAPETNYTPRVFGGILSYEKPALEEYHKEQARQRWHETIASCTLCDAAGWTTYEDQSGSLRMGKCPHDLQAIRTHESKTGLTWKGV